MKENTLLLERGEHKWSDDSIRMILTPSRTAKSLYFYTQEVGYFKTEYPYFSEREHLDSFLIIYTISGHGLLNYEGIDYSLKKGDCLFIHCESHHLYRTAKEKQWEFLWIHFNGNNALGYYKEFIKSGFKIIRCQKPSFWENALHKIITLYQQRNTTTEPLVSHLISSMLTELLLEVSPTYADTLTMPDYIQGIAKDIDKNFRTDLTLDFFEEKYHRSRYHMLKQFKKYTGTTITEYIILTRISHAKELLKYTELSVNDIAFESGFHNVTHFINMFKARENITPHVYRTFWKN